MINSYPVSGSQPISTIRTVTYPGTTSFIHPQPTTSPNNTTICSDAIKTDFGKIKGIEVLYFRGAQLERTINGESKFASVGPLQVLYFPQYDRFVLSLNSWKYPLLKRVPIVASSAAHGLPVTYTLPTVGGFFSLVIPKVDHLEGLYNLEAILDDNSKLTFSDSDDVMSHSNTVLASQSMMAGQNTIPSNFPLNGNMVQGSLYPHHQISGQVGQSFHSAFQSNVSQSTNTAPKKQSRWKRILFGPEYKRDKGDRIGTSKHNLNMIQKRDLNSIKMTTEVMAAAIYYPRKEVERWIIYNKEMANLMNFSPELQDQDFDAFGHSSILNRSNIDVDPSLPCNQPITSEKPLENTIYQPGRNFTSTIRHDGKRNDGYITAHSHSIHPDVSGRFNNLSTSQFEPDRFKNMSNAGPLYEATGISPINKVDNPFSFTQDDVLEDSRPSITERITGAVTNTNETKHFDTLRQQEKQMSFADKFQESTQPSTLRDFAGHTGSIPSTLPTYHETLYPTTQSVSSNMPTLQERIRNTPSSTEQPGLLGRIKEAVTGTGHTEHPYDLSQTHYAA